MKRLRIAVLTSLLSAVALPAAVSADVLPPDSATPTEDAGTSDGGDDGGCAIGVAGGPLGASVPLAVAAGLLFVRRRSS